MRLDRWVLVPALTLASCAHVSSRPAPPTQLAAEIVGTRSVSRAVEFFQHLQALNQEELRIEYSRVADDYAATPTLDKRIQLILLLTYPRAHFRDLDAALQLIDDYLVDAAPGAVTDFFWLLEANVQMQRTYEQKIRAADVRAEQLQQQLNALKSIERAIHARETGVTDDREQEKNSHRR